MGAPALHTKGTHCKAAHWSHYVWKREIEEHKKIKWERSGEGIVCKLSSSTSSTIWGTFLLPPHCLHVFPIETSLNACILSSMHICLSINKHIRSRCLQEQVCLLFPLIDAKRECHGPGSFHWALALLPWMTFIPPAVSHFHCLHEIMMHV